MIVIGVFNKINLERAQHKTHKYHAKELFIVLQYNTKFILDKFPCFIYMVLF